MTFPRHVGAYERLRVRSLIDACNAAGDAAALGSHRRREFFRMAARLGAIERGELPECYIDQTLAEARTLTGKLL